MACVEIAFVISMVTLTYSQTISIRPLGGEVFWEGGGPIELKCIVLADRFSNIYWIRDNNTVWSLNDEILVDLSPNHKVSHSISRSGRASVDLYIETAQRKHSGFYTCLAEDPVTHEQIEAYQYIRVKYVPHQKYPLCLVEDGRDSQRLSCVTEPGSPQVILKWFSSALNSTELSSEIAMQDGMLTQNVDFGNLYPPEGERLSSDTVFICKMYIEDYGALHSCSVDALTVYALNSSFDILPLDLSVVFGESFVATCVSSLPLATFVVTLHLPNRPPKQPRTIRIDNGEAVVIHNINFDYNGAILSCQMKWGPFHGRTKMSRITVTPFIEPIESQLEQDNGNTLSFGGNSQDMLRTSPTLKPTDKSNVNMQQNERDKSSTTSLDRYPSKTFESGYPALSETRKEWIVQLPANDYDGYSSPSLSETETVVQNGKSQGTGASPSASSRRSSSTSEGTSKSVMSTKPQSEDILRGLDVEDVWPNNMINDALHGDNIHDSQTKDGEEEIMAQRDGEFKTTLANEVTTLNGPQPTNDTSLDSSSNDTSNMDMKGRIYLFSGDGVSSPVGTENFDGKKESPKTFTMVSWTSEKPANYDGTSVISESSYGLPRRPDIPMENGTYYETENMSVMLAILFILISFLLFLVLCFILGLTIRKCYRNRQRNNVKTVVG